MQATQSNKASDFSRSDSTDSRGAGSVSGNARSHDLLPPLSAPAFLGPIQAARRYIERQRGGAAQAETLAGIPHNREHPNREQTSREQTSREQTSREQDRRLERSLYAGHSIEAGLAAGLDADLDADHPYGALDMGVDSGHGRELACLAESDGSEPIFPYALPHPRAGKAPETDPNAVRGAIQRLARESGAMFEPSRAALSPAQPGHSSPIESQQRPPAFAEVARRVWETHRTGEAAQLSGGATEMPELPVPRARVQFETTEAVVSSAIPSMPEEGSAFTGSPLLPDRTLLPRTLPPSEAQKEVASDGPALAHDACNLLSALGLYSDLLSAPGVLDGPHLRYAEELKLIAGRSQSLIDRLLRVNSEAGEMPQGGEPAVPASGSLHLVDAPAAQQTTGIYLTRLPEAQLSAVPGADEPAGGPQTTSLVDLLMRWGSLLSTLAHGTLDVAFGPDAATPVPVAAEPLERILVNLVKNARAATVAGGAIRIGVAARGELCQETAQAAAVSRNPPFPAESSAVPIRTVVLTVDDSGCGMTEAQVSRILGIASCARAETVSEGYGRWREEAAAEAPAQTRSLEPIAESASEPGRGTSERRRGLGLQVIRELVSASGGRLAIQSRQGRGTRIEIGWPVPHAVDATETPIETSRPSAAADPSLPTAISTAIVSSIQPVPASMPQSAAAATVQAVIGPDGFSEQELRAMMLRLHRSGPSRAEENSYSALKGAIAC